MISRAEMPAVRDAIVEEEIEFTLVELCQACHAPEDHVIAWVVEGALEPIGASPQDWRFSGRSLRRARLALWLGRDLEINPPGVALALDLFDRIVELEGDLARCGLR